MSFRYTRPEGLPPIVKNLLFINALFFLATKFLFRDKIFFPGLEEYGLEGVFGLWPIQHPNFRPFQVFTHMFTHASIGHIFFNMFSLWVFGRTLENIWGPKRFLLFYLLCGLGSAVAHSVVQYFQFESITPLIEAVKASGDKEYLDYIYSRPRFAVGASGAVMGVMVAFAYLFPNTELWLYFAIPVKAKWVILALIAFDLIYGLGKTSTGVAHWAHLGGAATGFLLVYIWNKTNKKTFY